MGFFSSTFGGGPGNAARARRAQEIADRQAQEAATQDPYGPNAPHWDENGFPVGPMPKGKYALDYQYEANRRSEARRRTLWGDAQQSMRQGLDLFQSYRPGGSAAVASGMFGQKAQLYGTEALNVEAPDLLIDYREQIRKRAEENANKLNRNAQLITGLSAFNVLGGGTVAALQGQPGQQDPNANRSTAKGGQVPGSMQGDPGSSMFGGGPGQPGGQAPDAGYRPGALGPEGGGQGTPGSNVRGMDQAGGATVDGSYGSGGGGGPGGMGGGGSRVRGAGGPGGGGGMAGAGERTSGLATFDGPEVAGAAMGQAPGSLDTTTELWADDPSREESTALMQFSARGSMLSAIALASKPQYSGAEWQRRRFGGDEEVSGIRLEDAGTDASPAMGGRSRKLASKPQYSGAEWQRRRLSNEGY